MKGACSCSCQESNRRSDHAGLFRQRREPALSSYQRTSPSYTFGTPLPIHKLGEHEELLPWLYRIVASAGADSSSEQRDSTQRYVGSILRNVLAEIPSDQVKVMEAIELGSDSLKDTAARLNLTEANTIELHTLARANFISVLSRQRNPVSLASHA